MKVFCKERDKIMKRNISKKAFVTIIIVLAAAVVLISSIRIVPTGSTGVVLTMGKVSGRVMSEGLNVKAPFVQSVAIINNKIQVVEIDAAAVSSDLQTVSSTIAVNYRISFDKSASLYQNIGRNYEEVVLLPSIKESIKSVTAKYTAEQLITLRAQVGQEMKETLDQKVNVYGIMIDKFNIVNFDFSAEFNSAIEAKQVAEQNLIKTKTEQEQAIVIAESEAKRKIIAAKAEADAITAKADAQSKANKLLAQSLTDNVVEYEKIQKWNGELPKATGANSIIDMRENSSEK